MRWYAIPGPSCRLLERFRVTIPEVPERVCLLLWLSAEELMSALLTAHVALDTFHFGLQRRGSSFSRPAGRGHAAGCANI